MMSTFGNAWAQALVQLAAPEEGDRVLDVACGTGAVARYAAALVGGTGRVVGLDLNAGMLAVAREMHSAEGISITWQEGNATALPFPNASFDVVCCHQGLQFFPDRSAALQEMFRNLAPAGRLALGVWRGLQHQPFYSALTEALERSPSPTQTSFAPSSPEQASAISESGSGVGSPVIRLWEAMCSAISPGLQWPVPWPR
jgi:ubiquinone/menaquinone biosynthesis C-methylase UbiE